MNVHKEVTEGKEVTGVFIRTPLPLCEYTSCLRAFVVNSPPSVAHCSLLVVCSGNFLLTSSKIVCSPYRLNPAMVHVDKFVLRQESLNLRPDASGKGVKFGTPQVTDAETHHPGWRA